LGEMGEIPRTWVPTFIVDHNRQRTTRIRRQRSRAPPPRRRTDNKSFFAQIAQNRRDPACSNTCTTTTKDTDCRSAGRGPSRTVTPPDSACQRAEQRLLKSDPHTGPARRRRLLRTVLGASALVRRPDSDTPAIPITKVYHVPRMPVGVRPSEQRSVAFS
jgi:hypothetical protein